MPRDKGNPNNGHSDTDNHDHIRFEYKESDNLFEVYDRQDDDKPFLVNGYEIVDQDLGGYDTKDSTRLERNDDDNPEEE